MVTRDCHTLKAHSHQDNARISHGNPTVPLELKTLLQAKGFESIYGKQIVLDTGLCIFSDMYFG